MKKFLLACLLTSALTASADTMQLGYSEGEFSTTAPVGASVGDNNWIEVAAYIPASTIKSLAGKSITEITGYLPSNASIETIRVWLKTDLEGEPLVEKTLVPTQLNNVQKGFNKLKFDTPYIIPADLNSGIYIGFGHKTMSMGARGISATDTPIPGAFYLHRADDKWYDFSYRGTACVMATVEGENLPEYNLHLSNAVGDPYLINDKGTYSSKLYIHNFGTKDISGFEVTAELQGAEKATVKVDKNIRAGRMGVIDLTLPLKADRAGKFPLVYSVSNLKEGTDCDLEDNVFNSTADVASTSYPRYVLSEEFTTEMCGNCPPVTKMIHELLQEKKYENIIQVCHHSGYKTDFLTSPWHETFVKLFGGGSFAPALGADRAELAPDKILIYPETRSQITDMWDARLATPAVVKLDMAANYVDNFKKKVTVTVNAEKSIAELPGSQVVNIMVIEDGIKAVNQASGGKDYVHDHVSRAVSAESHWGDPVNFDGDNMTYSYTFTLDPSWNTDNLSFVAYIGDNTKWSKHEIMNAARIPFSAIGNSGIEEVSGNDAVVKVEYFDFTGRCVIEPSGLVIKRSTYTDGKVKCEKVIK
ncbi:MAG: Omp28-related outer membrane protein [Muribaculaceae bacterium]|nr:Omp28-related outer membrane protein [Muribaculaceae bacterium]